MPILAPLIVFAPILLLVVAALALLQPGRRPGTLPRLAEGAALGVLALALASVVQLIVYGPATLAFGSGMPSSRFALMQSVSRWRCWWPLSAGWSCAMVAHISTAKRGKAHFTG